MDVSAMLALLSPDQQAAFGSMNAAQLAGVAAMLQVAQAQAAANPASADDAAASTAPAQVPAPAQAPARVAVAATAGEF